MTPRSTLLLVIATLVLTLVLEQAESRVLQDDDDPVKAAELISEAIKARGGAAYLTVRSIRTEGEYTPFVKGVSALPERFIDYIVYPDRERTEFGKGDRKYIQTNTGNTGWIYEAEQKMIRDQKEDQIKRWLQGIRYDLDNLLRTGSKQPGVKLTYLGRREAWHNTFAQAVKMEFSDGASVTIHFDPRSKLPMMTEFKTVAENKTVNEQIRYYQWIEVNGVQFPKIQDSYREGVQTSRAYFEAIEFNMSVPERLFAKPATYKEIK